MSQFFWTAVFTLPYTHTCPNYWRSLLQFLHKNKRLTQPKVTGEHDEHEDERAEHSKEKGGGQLDDRYWPTLTQRSRQWSRAIPVKRNKLTFSQDSVTIKPLALPSWNYDTVSNGNSNPLPLHQVTWSRETRPNAKLAHTTHPTVANSNGGLVLDGSGGEV